VSLRDWVRSQAKSFRAPGGGGDGDVGGIVEVVVWRVLGVPTTTRLEQEVLSSSPHLRRRWAGEAAPSRRVVCATTTPRCSSAVLPTRSVVVAQEASIQARVDGGVARLVECLILVWRLYIKSIESANVVVAGIPKVAHHTTVSKFLKDGA